MTFEDITLKQWIESELEEYKESWKDIIYHSLGEKELSESIESIPDHLESLIMDFGIWTKKNVYQAVVTDHTENGWVLIGISRNPPE